MTYGYTNDGVSPAANGYFVLTTQNPLSQTTTTEHSPADGQVKRTIDPNGLSTTAVYDAFGRMIRTDYKDAGGAAMLPSTYVGYASCVVGACPSAVYEGSYEDHAAWRVTQVQSGAPTQVSWYDALGRVIKHAERGFDGTLVLGTSEYDDMSTVVFQSAPFHAGDTVYLTGWNYDVLSRPTQKVVSGGAEMDPTHGDVITTYGYDGRKTIVKVRGASTSATCSSSTNLCMDMTRTYDVLGRLEQTTQNNGATANYAVTNYWYDGPGNAVALKDAEGNVITASYDDRGRRTQVVDPDAGTKTFTYDALGELLTQLDARGVSTEHHYDALGRLLERTATDATAVAPLPAVIRDTWVFDPTGTTGGKGLLDYAQRQTGASTSGLSQIFKETYRY
jgi:YD repeat-containing protein